MARQLVHRGPDGEGVAVHGRAGLAHRRLATMQGGVQPLRSVDGRFLTVFDGEVYNHRELGDDLAGCGHVFRTRSHAEVVLAAWVRWGAAAFDRCNGAFALAILDTTTGELVLARDLLGIKPLYLAADGSGRVAFGSEIRPVLAAGVVPRRPDEVTIYRYLKFGVTDDTERTFFDRVTQLLPGQLAVISPAGQIRRQAYARLRHELEWLAADPRPYDAGGAAALAEVADTAVQRRLTGPVPVGTVPASHARPAPEDLLEFVRTQQEPVASLAPYTRYCGLRAASRRAAVLWRGPAGDYHPYLLAHLRQLRHDRRLLAAATTVVHHPDLLRRLVGAAGRLRRQARLMPAGHLLAVEFAAAHAEQRCDRVGDDLKRRLADDLFQHRGPALLRYEDRSTTRFAMLGRVPFLDPDLLRLQWSLDAAAIIGRGWHGPALGDPAGDLAWQAWFASMKPFVSEVFSSSSFGSRPYVEPAAVTAGWRRWQEGGAGADPVMWWRLLNLELWLRELVDRDPTVPLAVPPVVAVPPVGAVPPVVAVPPARSGAPEELAADQRQDVVDLPDP